MVSLSILLNCIIKLGKVVGTMMYSLQELVDAKPLQGSETATASDSLGRRNADHHPHFRHPNSALFLKVCGAINEPIIP